MQSTGSSSFRREVKVHSYLHEIGFKLKQSVSGSANNYEKNYYPGCNEPGVLSDICKSSAVLNVIN